MDYNIFTYDKISERKSGVLTMAIFSACLLLFPLFIIIFDLAGVSFFFSFVRNYLGEAAPIYYGLEFEAISYVMTSVYVLLAVSIPMVICYAIVALKGLLICYVQLEDGSLVKLRWQPRPSKYAQAYAFSRSIAENIPSADTAYTYRTLKRAAGVIIGIENIQNPQFIADYIEGRLGSYNIEDYPLSNIQLVKRTKKKIVILADTIIKGKPKRKKMKIYCIYNDMERLFSICEGGLAQ